jgi:SAM-dependent methyltransferase
MNATPIANFSEYNSAMRKSMVDKMFFIDKVDAKVFVDFGCADGSLLKTLEELFPEYSYIGYDYNPQMIEAAEKGYTGKINFTSNWGDVVEYILHSEEKTCLFCLSVVHEVYSYGLNEVNDFWNKIFSLNTDFVVFRDMAVSKTASRQSDSISVAKIRQRFDNDKIAQWESIWGSLNENWSLVHFLLTYRFEVNWEREVKENYLPLSMEDFLTKIPNHYRPTFFEHFTLPFVRNQVKKDFDVELQERTHLKLIFEK